MSNIISSYSNNYPVANTGINQQQIDKTINKSKDAVNTTVESNALLSSSMGMDKESVLFSLPLIALIKVINNVFMAGSEEKSLVGRMAKLGDKISDTFKLESKATTLKPKLQKTVNNRFFKFFGDSYKANAKSALGNYPKLSVKYSDALKEVLEAKGIKTLTETSSIADVLKEADDYILKHKGENLGQIKGLRNMLKAADSNVGKTTLGKLFAKGSVKTKEIVFSTSDFLGKNKMTLATDFFSIVLFASVLKKAIQESKEAPKGEKLSTFAHILSSDYAPLMVMMPATNMAYRLAGNKYRGMGVDERKLLADIVQNANKPKVKVSDAKIVKSVDELLENVNIPEKSIIDKFKAFFIKDKARMQHSLLWAGVDEAQVLKLKDTSWFKLKFFEMKKLQAAVPDDVSRMMSLKHTLFSKGVDAAEIAKLDGKPIEEATQFVKGILSKLSDEHVRFLKVSEIQKDALLKGAKKADVESIAKKTAEEAAEAAKGFAKKLDLKWWEKPLKSIGKFLGSSLDDIPQTTAVKKFAKKAKGFGAGAMRFVLILFVLQPLLQKPIEKLTHKIFGKPEAYLKKEEAEAKKSEEKTSEQSPVQENTSTTNSSTNLINQYTDKQPVQSSQTTTQPAQTTTQPAQTTTQPAQTTALPEQATQKKAAPIQVNRTPSANQQATATATTEDPSAALNLFDKNKNGYKGYIPSTKVEQTQNLTDKEIEKQVDEILKETDGVIKRLRVSGL